jgi:ORF6N domain
MPHPTSVPALPPIHTIRGQRVVIDSDLARLYGVLTKRLNEAVRRNANRFPREFCFQLAPEEHAHFKSQAATSNPHIFEEQPVSSNWSQIATSSRKHRGAAYRPWVFTEHGALMAATVLNSPQAVQMSLYVVRAFVRMREELMASAIIFKRLAVIDKQLMEHDVVLQDVVEKLLPLLNPPPDPPKRRIGFHQGGR